MSRDLLAEISELRQENEKLLAEIHFLKVVENTTIIDLQSAFDMWERHACIVALMLSGRPYSDARVILSCWPHGATINTLRVTVSMLRTRHPWVRIHKTGWHSPYIMSRRSINHAKAGIARLA